MFEKSIIALVVTEGDPHVFLQDALHSLTLSEETPCLFIVENGLLQYDLEQQLNAKNLKYKIIKRLNVVQPLSICLNEIFDYVVVNCPDVEFIFRFDPDDLCLPDRFERQLIYLNQNPSVMVLGGNALLINEQGKVIGHRITDERTNILQALKKCPLIHPSVVFRVALIRAGYRYNVEFKNGQDYDLWLRLISANHVLGNIPDKPVVALRVSADLIIRRFGFLKNYKILKIKWRYGRLNNLGIRKTIAYVLPMLVRLMPQFAIRPFAKIIQKLHSY